ncbi:PQQ-dependent sugar dehydrogenase [Horticoccus sp. 23ND18S-11]|uniref:PQQ-dependent sugar dehydrogenase n=1 Tax=Horticoccus sp. 23ND18S-11 TaxID=3391832 RepID=UPI0039C99D6A
MTSWVFRALRASGLAAAAAGSLIAFAQQPAPAPALKAYRDFALRRDGNAARGREIFFSERTACAQCHTVDGSGSAAGPDLSAVGDAVPRPDLVTAVLEPSATIAVGYAATLIETQDGERMLGVIKREDAAGLELMGADRIARSVAVGAIKQRTVSDVSLMPPGLHSALSPQEFTDVIEYLVSLKQPANALAGNRGMPDEIPVLAKPVALRPLFTEAQRFPPPVIRRGEPRLGLVWCGQVPGEPDVFLVAHQSGKIWRMDRRAGGEVKTLFGDFGAELFSQRGPNGLLGFAFHPQFRANRKYYLKHQVLEAGKILTVLSEKVAATDLRADSGEPSRRLWSVASVTQDHSGGCIEFGPDGFLYLGMGDTGPQQDPNGHGQDLRTHLGKILRLDVDRRDAGLPYAIPADNPFRNRADARPEIWAVGFREPWRFTFDRATGDLWVGDVGQNRVEEVAIVRRGENHGWNVYEAFEIFSQRYRREGETYVPPVAAYKRKYGNSVTGGYVYRGDPASSFHGVYVFGDYTSKLIFGLTQEGRTLSAFRQIGTSPESIASFATDERGRIYVVGYEGMIFEIDFTAGDFKSAPQAANSPRVTAR